MLVVINMISREENPYFLNDFLDYSATILNKSSNTIKEYNYDIAHFLKFIQYEFGIAKLNDDKNPNAGTPHAVAAILSATGIACVPTP